MESERNERADRPRDESHHRAQQVVVQPKLEVGASNDPMEREADQVAATVVARLPRLMAQTRGASVHPAESPGRVQRFQLGTIDPVADTAPSPISRIQAKGTQPSVGLEGGAVDQDTESRITRATGGGQPIENGLRESLETGFGADFSAVRVHTDATANNLNERIQAKAFTTGSDIFFRQGEYAPTSTGGQHLLAHELTHVVQQRGTGLRRQVDKTPAIIQRWGKKSRPKPPMEIGSPTNVTGVDAVLQGRDDVVAAGPQHATTRPKPPPPPGNPIRLTQAVTGFAVDTDGVLQPHSARVSIPKGQTLVTSGSKKNPEKATNPDGKPSDLVLAMSRGVLYAFSPSVIKPKEPTSKAKKAAGKGLKVLNFMAGATGAASDSRMNINAATGRGEAARDATSAGGQSTAGADVDYSQMSAAEQSVYDKANHYDPTGSAISAGVGTFGSWFSLIGEMKGFHDNWSKMNKKKKADAIANSFRSILGTAGTTVDFIAQSEIAANPTDYASGAMTSSFGKRPVKVAGPGGKLTNAKEDYQATDMEKGGITLSLITGGVDAALKIKDAIVDFYTWAKHLGKAEKHGNLAREGVSTLKSFGAAAQTTMNTVIAARKFFEGAAGVAWQAMPIFGLVMNAIEVVRRGMDIHRARMDGVLVKKSKKGFKEQFAAWWPGEKIDHRFARRKRSELEAGLEPEDAEDDQAEEQIEAINEYLLDRDLANTSNKRRNRAILGIVVEAQSIAANIATLAGQLHVSAALKSSGSATGYGAVAIRKLKQFGRDHGLKGFNKNKSTKNKDARYAEIAERLYGDFVAVHTAFHQHLQAGTRSYNITSAKDFDMALQNELMEEEDPPDLAAIESSNAQLKGRVKAAGLSWREFCAQTNPVKRFQMLVSGQKKRE